MAYQQLADMGAFGVDRKCPHHGFGGSYRSHVYDYAIQNTAVATEGDGIELHALDADLGLVLNHEIEAAAIVGILDAVELDADLFLGCERYDRQQEAWVISKVAGFLPASHKPSDLRVARRGHATT